MYDFVKSLTAVILLITSTTALAQQPSENTEQKETATMLKIKLASVFVDDQAKAEKFYTEVLGFVKKQDEPVGEFRWLTVVSPSDSDGVELLLEPNDNPAAATFQKAIYEQGIPATALFVENIHKTYERLQEAGVKFTTTPTEMGTTTVAIFDDTCGNLISIAQE